MCSKSRSLLVRDSLLGVSHFLSSCNPIREMVPKQKSVHVSLRNVTPTIPGNELERGMLKSDLEDLGCAGLLERPWNLKSEDFIQQFVLIREGKLERNNMFDTTIWD